MATAGRNNDNGLGHGILHDRILADHSTTAEGGITGRLRKNQVKLLVWTRGGFTVVHKRLERGTFAFAADVTGEALSVEIDVHELSMLLEGIDVRDVRTSARWEPALHAHRKCV